VATLSYELSGDGMREKKKRRERRLKEYLKKRLQY
jgi:hypothetical protein